MPVADVNESTPEFFARLEPGARLAGCYLLKKKVPGTARPLWIAEDEVLGKEIALHFLSSGLLKRSDVMDRLRQEVKRARQLVNPRVLRVHDLVEEEDWAAVAMDSFAGQPLSAVVAENSRGIFEAGEVWPLARELCETLDEAHRLGFVHGGLSPENVLVGEGKAKVMNFGISAAVRAVSEAPAPFASEQQLSGAASTTLDDVFATGALLHTLLAGAAPFEGTDRTNALSVGEHRRKLNRSGNEVPENWESTLANCLSADPAKRPASCGEIAKQLEVPAAAAVPAPVAPVTTPPPVAEPAPAPVPAVEVVPPPAVEPTAAAAVGAAPAIVVESTPASAPAAPADPTPAAKEEVTASVAPVEEAKPAVKEEAPVAPAPKDEPPASKEEARPEEKPSAETKSDAKEEKSAAAQTGPARPTGQTGRTSQTTPSRVNEDALAAEVRREEARRFRQDDEEEFYDRSHGSGPSVLTWFIVVAVVGIFGYFVLLPVLFPKTSSSSSGAVTNVELATPEPVKTSTPEPTPLAKKEPSTPAAQPATPAPETTPKPMAQDDSVKPPTPAPSPIAPAIEPKQIETAIAELRQTREKAAKELPTTKKAADELSKQEQKFTEDLKKAEAAAAEAEKAAADRKKALEDLRKTAAAATEQLNAKKTEVAKGEEHLTKLDLDLKEKERALLDAKATAEAAKRREVEAMRLPSTPQPTVMVKATPTPAPMTNAASATPAPRTPATPVPDDPRLAFEAKMKELSKALSATPAPTAPATPVPGATPAPSTLATPAPASGSATAPAMELAKVTTPEPVKAGKTEGNALVNSLGMKLIPLSGSEVMMGIWPVRVRDFDAFARKMGLKSTLWRDPGFKQSGDHPVVNVTWEEAMAFCKWLTTKERAEGVISANQSYRLPTDLEWSRGAGLGAESGATPEMRDMGVADVYPWGKAWPPPTGAGNYTGEETGSDVAIKGYNDGFPWTSPVGSFPANKLGFYDMGGNVWQWCMDSWSADSKAKVLRGASWYNGALKLSLLTSCRVHASPDSCTDNYGFRVVLAGSAK